MVEDDRVADVADHHAVMVDDHDALGLFIQAAAFNEVGGMGVHNDQQGVVGEHRLGLLGGNKDVFSLRLFDVVHQHAREGLLPVDHHIGRLAQ